MYINIMKLRIDKQVTILFTALPIENYGMMPFCQIQLRVHKN